MHIPDRGQAKPALGVIGGGIGGLAAAIAAARAGWQVSLWEQASAFGEAGAGIQLGPNATRRLQHWGVLPSLLACAVEPAALHVRCASGGVTLGRLPLASRVATRLAARS